MNQGNLSEFCPSYYANAGVYERFAECEDAPGKIAALLAGAAAGKRVLDVGCGSGKYARLVAPVAARYFGVDQSPHLLAIARRRADSRSRAEFIEAPADGIPLPDHSIDLVFASWVLGTIADEERRESALFEMMRVLAPGGRILLIENDEGGMFEYIRGRYPDTRRTRAYNRWVEAEGLSLLERVETFFEFTSLGEARSIVSAIWGNAAGRRVRGSRVPHKVVVFGSARRAT